MGGGGKGGDELVKIGGNWIRGVPRMDTGINLFNFILFINLKSNESWMFDYILRKLSEVDCWQFCEGKMNESRRF